MRKTYLVALPLISALLCSASAQATEPLDCESSSYLVRIVLGSDDTVGNVILYDKKKTYEANEVPTIATARQEVKWKKSVLIDGVSGAPRFHVEVKGKSGWVEYDGKREKIRCEWFQ